MSKRTKIVVDNRPVVRDWSNKVFRNTLGDDGVGVDEAIEMAIDGADWTDDPGTGRAVILIDGRELLNPVPVAPPVSISNAETSVNELVDRALRMHFERIEADKEANETLDDLLSFDDDLDDEPRSPWEIVDLRDEVPDIPRDNGVAEPSAAAVVPPADQVVVKKPPKGAKAVVQADLDEEGA